MDEQQLYNRIAELRAARALSQQQLADTIGVSRKTISTEETSRFTPSVLIALQLAHYLDVPVEQIFSLSSFR
ncbi:Putative transcriptional regulator [Rheinheimera sp. A13L]|uniref:helix-turn-helix transcriptional regulator n=1 Tax=Rheinheimera sp. A13L TaxID=506534 RepID=UPI0002124F50|nr:helix-turn-helix transcriptional regulator [Rheinheimera sp. A13L]EGM79545.1 Putative transcriptional regulator [Rheinheimera sp. A13L]